MLALIGNLDTTELLVVLFAAILVFGRRLPQVASQAGQQLGKLRRTLDSAWRDSGVDREMREVQRSIESIRDAMPRDLSPASIARTAATEFQRRVEANALTEEEIVKRRAEPYAAVADAPDASDASVAPPAARLAAPASVPALPPTTDDAAKPPEPFEPRESGPSAPPAGATGT